VRGVPGEILDAHHHLWDLSRREQPWLATHEELAPLRRNFTAADMLPLAEAAGVTATIVIQTVTEPGETREMLALAAAGPLVTAVVGWVDLSAPDVADALAGLMALPDGAFLAGNRHPVLFEPDPDWLTRPEILRGLAAVAAAGLTYDFVVRPEQLPAAVQAATALPGLPFVLDHFGNVDVAAPVDEAWERSFRQLAALPNTTCKLSGILSAPPPSQASGTGQPHETARPGGGPDVSHLRPYYEIAMDSFGPERMMFGSDWPVSSLGASYGDVVGAALALTKDLGPADCGAIFGATARRVYRLGGLP
jgi:L-fuconolactonase